MVLYPSRFVVEQAVGLNGQAKKIFDQLTTVEEKFRAAGLHYRIMIKGGRARELLGGKPTAGSDLDLILGLQDTFAKELQGQDIFTAAQILQETLGNELSAEDVEPIRYEGKLIRGIPKSVISVLNTRDQTRNEVVLMKQGDKLMMYYTRECQQAIARDEAVIAPGDPTVSRIHIGKFVILPRGAARMICSAVKEQDIRFIHLPRGDVDIMIREAKGYEPLGAYGILLCEYLKGYSEEVKTNAMKLLVASRLTRITNFKEYGERLHAEHLEKYGQPFVLNKDRSLYEVFMSKKFDFERREHGKEQRKEDRDNCCCPEEKLIVDKFKQVDPFKRTAQGIALTEVFRRERCPFCGWFEITDAKGEIVALEDLPSNKIRVRAKYLAKSDFLDVEKTLAKPMAELIGHEKIPCIA